MLSAIVTSMRLHPVLLALGLLVCASASGCFLTDRPMVGVKRVRPAAVDAELNANALDGEAPSVSTLEFLHTFGLREQYDDDPAKTLLDLHKALCADPERRGLHALADIAFLEGKRLKNREHYLAAAVYAYLFLLGEDKLAPVAPAPGTRLAACRPSGLLARFPSPDAQATHWLTLERTPGDSTGSSARLLQKPPDGELSVATSARLSRAVL